MVSPFKTGNGIVLESAFYTFNSWYMDSSLTAAKNTSVYLSNSMDFETHPGCYWAVTALPNTRIQLKSVTTGSNRRYLDSSGAAEPEYSVYLTENTAGRGSDWFPTSLSYNQYTFKSDTPSGTKRYMDCDPYASKEKSVYLSDTTEYLTTTWNLLLTHYAGESVQSIISAVYPGVPISSYETNATYGSLEYDRLHGIWKDTQLGDNQITPNASDFAVCVKAEVYKHSYNSDSPWPNDKGSLCGIMWGSIGGKICALNFTIDKFQKLILFDPQNGQQIANDKFTPTFCMV